ncbi:MAG TPA: DNRLRE domain-containing protein [Aggregatilineaceae bacterium]|nr:DNRLRE domain-containing protein [Aggregatilineaceae bacterium]
MFRTSLHLGISRRRLALFSAMIVAIFVSFYGIDLKPDKTTYAQSGGIGYADFAYGSSSTSSPTGEKPESKLWWNDGYWWGDLFSASANQYHIYRLNLATQTWSDTGTALDNRPGTKADTLWDGASQKLYVVSHTFTTSGASTTTSSQWGRLYRYSYNSATDVYSLDAGFPVTVTQGKSETLTVAKDSTGRLWVSYVEGRKVMVNHSTSDDLTWGTPYVLPTSGVNVSSDDISAVSAFQGNKIGIVWSNQSSSTMYFAYHNDGNVDTSWQQEIMIQGSSQADDHINIKTDSSGRLFVAGKTSLTGSNPMIVLYVRSTNGTWTRYTFGTGDDSHTRPIVLLDEEHNRLYLFAAAGQSGGAIYYKSTDMNNISFAPGMGDVILSSNTATPRMNNVTSTKQNLNSTTGLVIAAVEDPMETYFHNYLTLSGGGGPTSTPTNTPTSTATFTPSNTPSNTPTPTVTYTPSNTPTPTVTYTPSDTPTPTVTYTPSDTPTSTATYTPSDTPTSTATYTPSNTPTNTPIPPPVRSFAAIGDTQVKLINPNSNYGALDTLRARLTSSEDIDSYLKFDVTGVDGPILSAKLRLFVSDGSDSGGSLYLVSNNYRDTSTPWLELGLTWNNAPLMSGTPLGILPAVVTGTWVELDVSAVVTGNGTYSFGLTTDSSNSVLYNSKEALQDRPELVLEVNSGSVSTPTNTPTPTVTYTPSNTPTPTVTYTPSNTPIPLPVQSFAAIGDAQVKLVSPTSNYGSLDTLRARLTSSEDIDSYLKFDVTGIDGPVLSAKLRLFVSDESNSGGALYLVSNDYRDTTTPWLEGALTWNNAPLISGTPLSTLSAVALNTWAEFDVSAAVTGNGTYSFGLTSTSTNSVLYNSKEALQNQPELVLEIGTGDASPSSMTTSLSLPLPEVITVISTPIPTIGSLQVVESDSPIVLRTGEWTSHDTDLASAGRYIFSSGTLSDSLSILFQGTSADVVYVQHPALGTFAIEIDGALVQIVDAVATDSVFGARQVIAGLASGQHTLRIYPLSGTIAIDAFAVETPLTFPPTATPVPPTAAPTSTPLSPVLSLPFSDSFDSTLPWTPSGSWQLDTQSAYSGTGWFVEALTRNQISILTAGYQMDLRSAVNPQVTFWQQMTLTSGDTSALEISLDGGQTWFSLDLQIGTTSPWASRTVDLTPYRGNVIQLRFSLDTQGSVPEGQTGFGWWIDELAVTDASIIPPTVTPDTWILPTSVPTEVVPGDLPVETSTPVSDGDTWVLPTPAGE